MRSVKQRRLLVVILVITLAIAIEVIPRANPETTNDPTGTISLVKSGTTNISNITLGPTPNPINTTLALDLRIDNASNIWAWKVFINWTSPVLQLIKVREGSYLKSDGTGTVFIGSQSALWDNVNNTILSAVSGTRTDPSVMPDSSGVLATLTFNITAYGTCGIILSGGNLRDNRTAGDTSRAALDYAGVNATTINAFVVVTNSSSNSSLTTSPNSTARGPSAMFSPANNTSFSVDETITLDASASTPGYDTANVSEVCNITSFAWRVEYLNGTVFGVYNGQVTSFNATAEGYFRIILIVTAPDPDPPFDPAFIPTDTNSSLIRVGSTPLVSNVDVFTDRGGIGPGVGSGAYGSLELIRAYANVTYQSIPIDNMDVVFQIKNSQGSVVAVRVARTNGTGIAYTEYRLLNPNPRNNQPPNPEQWSITATVNVTQVTVTDTTSFTFGYLGSIQDIQIQSTVQRSASLHVQLTISNFVLAAAWSELDITLFDQANVPINSLAIMHTPQMQNSTAVAAFIPVPSYAFTGQATASICLLGKLPDGTTAPMAPETLVNFQILP